MDSKPQLKICRTCLTKASSYKSLLMKIDGEQRTLCEAISFITSIDILVNDKYPKNVCDSCFKLILKANDFKKRCLESETLLKNGYDLKEFIKHEITFNEKIDKRLQNDITTYMNKTELKPNITEVSVRDISFVKEENDDFLQDDMNDIPDSISIDIDSDNCQIFVQKLDIANSNLSGISIDDSQIQVNKSECKTIYEKTNEQLTIEYDNEANSPLILVCTICKEEFCNMQLLEDHIQLHKNETVDSIDAYQCPICMSYFTCESTWHAHMKNHNKSRTKQRKKSNKSPPVPKGGIKLTLVCPKCNNKFPNMQLFQLHLKTHVDSDSQSLINIEKKFKEKFQCSMCMRKFVLKKSLVAHIKGHEARAQMKFTCTFCKREFQYQGHLEKHLALAHLKDKNFTTKENTDINDVNKVKRKHECKICGKSFTMLSTLTGHVKTHTGEKPYLCSICGRGFSQKNNMVQHIRRHQGLKPFKCDICGRGFVSKGELEAHGRKHSGAHPFVCDDCGGSFTTSSSLTKHRRIHTGERPYACDLCSMRFSTLNTLKVHRRTHTGEKPYQCSYCEKAFRQRYDLVSHIRCHTGERPYVCTSCGQGFRKASALKLHIKVHGKEPMLM